jgi:hypothetical protein
MSKKSKKMKKTHEKVFSSWFTSEQRIRMSQSENARLKEETSVRPYDADYELELDLSGDATDLF